MTYQCQCLLICVIIVPLVVFVYPSGNARLGTADVEFENYFIHGKGTFIDLNIALKIETNVLD